MFTPLFASLERIVAVIAAEIPVIWRFLLG